MKKTLLAVSLAAVVFGASATVDTQILNAPFSGVETIDSSNWKYNPSDFGMRAEEFVRGEGLFIMGRMAQMAGGVNEIFHFTELASANTRWVVSPNNDVVYSVATVNHSEGFTVELPDGADRYVSLQIITEEHTSYSAIGGGNYTFEPGQFNGTHAIVGIRIGTDGTDADVEYIVSQLQPQMKLSAPVANPVPKFDKELLLKVRPHMLKGYSELPNLNGAMTANLSEVKDWEKYAYVAAGGWGLNFDEISTYAPFSIEGAKADTCYTTTFQTPEVRDFWSITAYNSENYLMADEYNVVNTNGNAKMNADGKTVTIYASNNLADAEKYSNFLYVTEDNWNALYRAYGLVDVKDFQDNFVKPEWTECQ